MVVPPYVHPFLLKLCDVWPSGRPSIRSSGPDVRRLPHFFLEQIRENVGSGGDKWGYDEDNEEGRWGLCNF